MTKVAIYARVSTSDKCQDPENQLRQLRRYCESQGWQIVEEYVDHASGTKADRIEFDLMFQAPGQGLSPPSQYPLLRSVAQPPCAPGAGPRFLDEAEHFLHNRRATVVAL